VIRLIKLFDALLGLGEGQLAAIDLLAAGNDSGDRAQPHADPRRADIHPVG
jgi:hypothetical protein